MGIQPGQLITVNVARRTNEDYVEPPRTAFHGSGNRLGAPVPGSSAADPTASAPSPIPGSFPDPSTDAPAAPEKRDRDAVQTRFEVDQTAPTTSVQIRLADGTRCVPSFQDCPVQACVL